MAKILPDERLDDDNKEQEVTNIDELGKTEAPPEPTPEPAVEDDIPEKY